MEDRFRAPISRRKALTEIGKEREWSDKEIEAATMRLRRFVLLTDDIERSVLAEEGNRRKENRKRLEKDGFL